MAKIDFKKIDTYRKSFDGILQVKKHVVSEDDLPVTGAQNGDIYTVGDSDTLYMFNNGEWGTLGSAGVTSATVTVDESTGTPSASASVENGVLSISFSGLKGKQGIQGNTGSSVDYPYELVNNLTTDDATKGLSAAQGVVLDGKVSQLRSEVEDIDDKIDGNVKDGYYLTTLGVETEGEGWCVSEKISVSPGDVVKYIPGTKWIGAFLVAFSSSNTRLAGYNANVAVEREITIPSNTSYIRASFSHNPDAGIKIGDNYIFKPHISLRENVREIDNRLGVSVQFGKAYSTQQGAVINKNGWIAVKFPVVSGETVVYNAGKAETPCGVALFSAQDERNAYYLASASDRTIVLADSTTYIIASVAIGTDFKITVDGVSVFGALYDVDKNSEDIKLLSITQKKIRHAIRYDFTSLLQPRQAVVIGSLGVGDILDLDNKINSGAWFGCVLECAPADIISITASGGSTVAPYIFIDNQNHILAFTTGSVVDATVVAPENTERIVCAANITSSTYTPSFILECGISRRIDAIENEISGDFETVPVSPVYVRKEAKDGTSFNQNVRLYPEGFMTEMGQHLMLNNSREWSPINLMMNSSHRETTQTLSVDVNRGGKSKTISIPVRRVNQALVVGKTAFILCIGESTTEANMDDPTLYDGTKHYSKFWGYPSALQYFAILDEAKYGNGNNIKTIGHKSNRDLSFEYEGQTYVNRSFCCGYGGHATYWLLNYPLQMQTTQSATIISGKDLWYFLGLATKTPYNQESYNAETTEWANDATHWALMTQTPAGKYKVDGCEELWNKIRDHASTVCGGTSIPSTTISGTYTGSAAQLASLNAWAEEVFANPENPFFDINVARDGVTGCAFSLTKYLERYRTMDNAGNRLTGSAGQTVVGADGNTYTIGTRVSDTSAWDVCTPTHIIFNIGINDNINNSVANTVANVKQLVGMVSVPVGYFVCRYGGVANSGQWFDVGTVEEVSLSSYNAQMVSELTAWFADNEVNGKYLLPVWHTMYPASSDTWCKEIGPTGQAKFLYETAIHTGYYGQESIGLECLSWVYYLITSATQF